MSDRDAFLAAIEASAWDDELPRLVYADWLDEHGEHDEADRQRKYVPALKVLIRYADTDYLYRPENLEERKRRYGDDCLKDYEDEGDDPFVRKPIDIKQVFAEIEWWKEGVLGKCRYGPPDGTPWIGFSSNFAQDELHDPEKRREFWVAFEVVTGIRAPEDLKQEWYHCAC